VTVEAADHYNGNGPDIICIAEADGFRDWVQFQFPFFFFPHPHFVSGLRWVENDVWDTDLMDPQRTGNGRDDDTHEFDRPSDSMTYFCGHGTCNDYTTQRCTTSTQCNRPQPGQQLPGSCVSAPPGGGGFCAYNTPRLMIMANTPNSRNGGIVNYSNGSVAWGESVTAGGWGGAGTNGGVNFAILSNSCGLRPPFFWEEAGALLAGVHVLGMIMPVDINSSGQSADDVDAPARGAMVAFSYLVNSSGSVGLAWAHSLNSLPQNDGSGCPIGSSSYALGGGHGISGCGAQVAISVDADEGSAEWHNGTESWWGLADDSLDARGAGWLAWFATCNYDCNRFVWRLP
jgi:hypothetical protein